jgi:hypothetical protein
MAKKLERWYRKFRILDREQAPLYAGLHTGEFAVCWNGLVYRVQSLGAPADLDQDVSANPWSGRLPAPLKSETCRDAQGHFHESSVTRPTGRRASVTALSVGVWRLIPAAFSIWDSTRGGFARSASYRP